MDNNLDNNQGGRRPDKGDPRRDQDPNRNKKNHQSILAFLICLLVTLVCFSLFTNMLQDNSSEITYDKFIDMVNNDEVKSVTLQSDNLTIVPTVCSGISFSRIFFSPLGKVSFRKEPFKPIFSIPP